MVKLKIGDRVALARTFLRSTFNYSAEAASARGRVLSLSPVRDGLDLAVVEWNRPDISAKVLTSNLTRADRVHLERV